ncbi:1866_t:CDS:2, partial [Dentiscutata heterogama]
MHNEALSEVSGYISIACWVVVTIPQLYENYKRKSSYSVSLIFLYIWLAGDLLNLTGSILQDLLPTTIYLAAYYVLSDIVIILQVYYYRRKNVISEELSPLLSERLESQVSMEKSRLNQSLGILSGLIGVCLTGVIAYCFSSSSQQVIINPSYVKGEPPILIQGDINVQQHMKLLPQILGWFSAIFYLGSRIPQIIQNYKSKSTEGLSLGMFCFSVLGNITFCLSILSYSMEYEHLLINLPWMLGSGGTLFFDFI